MVPHRFGGVRRALAIALGLALVLLGVLGLFLPGLQGILLIAVGFALLARHSRLARRLRARLRQRYPPLDRALARAERAAERWRGRLMDRLRRILHRPLGSLRRAVRAVRRLHS